jgi:hypothetical protein
MAKLSMILIATGFLLAWILGAASPGGAAALRPASSPVGPKQSFVGLVNGQSASATIDVLCPGPARLNQRGYAVSGQTVGVASPSAVATVSGFTGTKADSIVAEIVSPSTTSSSAAIPRVTFTDYGNKPIPTTVLLPCSGTSTAFFVPEPTSKTARIARVAVRFVPTCGSIVCPVDRTAGGRL